MLVERIMQPRLVTVTSETPLAQAAWLMRERGVRHLLVVDGGALVGILSDRDLKQAMTSPATSLEAPELGRLSDQLAVGEIMTRQVITVPPNLPVEEAARTMVRDRISALPVTLGGRLLGVVTETDVIRLFVQALGAAEPSSRIDVTLSGEGASLAEVVRIVEAAGCRPSGIMTLAGRDGTKEVVIRVPTIDPGRAIKALEAEGYPVADSWRG
jgi:acetoin utilization protein AcuB